MKYKVLLFCLYAFVNVFAQEKPNILFIAVDDMNDWVGAFGNIQAKTPNIDHLAERGVKFNKAYATVPVCNASRTSVLTGYHPSTTGIYDDEPVLFNQPDLVSLQETFKNSGYMVHGGGKIFHHMSGY